jgi:protoporphyrinogen oxidase
MSQFASVETDVLIVGAGPAGLTTSCLLTRALRDVVVIERDPQTVGGIARTIDHKGFLLDTGGHRFTSRSRAVEQFWRDLLPGDFVERPLVTRTWRHGTLQPHPLTAVDALRSLGPGVAAAGLLSLAAAKLKPIDGPRTLREWGHNAFGRHLFEALFRDRIEKACGKHCEAIPAERARETFDDLELGSPFWSSLADLSATPGGPSFRLPGRTLRYPRRGSGMLWNAAARKTREQGGRILMGHTLVALAFDATLGLWTATAETSDGGRLVVTARTVVASGPIPDLCGALRPTPISLFSARALRHRALVSVPLMTLRRTCFPDHWIDINDPTVKAFRVRNFGAHSPEMVPHPDVACVAVEYVCEEGDALWSMPDHEVVALARSEVERMGLLRPRDVIATGVLREAKACPLLDEEAEHHMAMVRLDLERTYPTLHLVGRNGTHGGHRQEHAVLSAMSTVQNILAGERIHDAWNPAREEARWSDGRGAKTSEMEAA